MLEPQSKISIPEVGDANKMTKMETISYLWNLFKNTHGGGDHRCKIEMEKVRNNLFTRAWLAHSILSLNRLVFSLVGNVFWQKSYQ